VQMLLVLEVIPVQRDEHPSEMKLALTSALAVLAAFPAFGQTNVTLSAKSWLLLDCDVSGDYCYNNDPSIAVLSNSPSGNLQFTFPNPSTGTANYLTIPWRASLSKYSTMTITVQTVALSGSPIFDFNLQGTDDGPHPASVRPYIQYVNDNGTGESYANKEWWADDPYSYTLDEFGVMTITVPLTELSVWSNESGQTADSSPAETAAFQNVLAHPGQIGMTFGGGWFYGHGITVEYGTAQFALSLVEFQ